MKENIKKIIAFLIATIILFVTMYSCGKVVNAEVPSNQIVVSHSGTWDPFPFTYIHSNKYYTVNDPTGIPTSTYLSPNYFYTTDNEKFFAINGMKVFTAVLNKLVGVIYEPNELNTLLTGFLTAVALTDTNNNKYIANCLYDSNDNFLGIALNDISGCYYGGNPPSGTNVKDDGNYSNNVKNYIDYEKNQGNFDIPDYFTFYGISDQYILNNLSNQLSGTQLTVYEQFRYDYDFIYGVIFPPAGGCKLTNYNFDNFIIGVNDVSCCICKSNSDTYWSAFVNKHCHDYEVLATDLIYENFSNSNEYVPFDIYDSNYQQITSGLQINPYNQSTPSSTSNFNFRLSRYMPFNFDKITFYRSNSVFNQINNNTYTPNVFYNDSFKNYNSSNDNSLDMAIEVIDQSVSYNSSIYDNSAQSFNNYYDNGVYDQSSAITNITNITNNYYNSSDDPDNPDNPDDPDDPDSPVLDEILAAILRFFNAIGDIIGTVLAGLVNMISAVLESIAEITSDITNLSDVFSSLLAWLPDPVPQIIGIGLSLVIIAGVIKFIRG